MSQRKNLIVDPSFFAHPKAVLRLLESELPKEYRVVIPTSVYQFISDRDHENFVRVIGRWELKAIPRMDGAWAEILDNSNLILRSVVPGARVRQELSPEQYSLLERINKTLLIPENTRRPDRLCLEMAKEIIETACIASLIVSVSNRAKEWYSKFSRAIVKRVEDNDTLMKAKEKNRNKLRQAGWKGSLIIWLCKHVPIPFTGDVVDTVVILSTNGAYKCQNCGKSLYRLPRDIAFCPYCSKPL